MPFWRSSVASPTSAPPRPASALERCSHGDSSKDEITLTSKCPSCGRQYDDSKRRPTAFAGCGHVVCRKCIGRDAKRGKCPLCAAASRTTRVECDIIRPASGKMAHGTFSRNQASRDTRAACSAKPIGMSINGVLGYEMKLQLWLSTTLHPAVYVSPVRYTDEVALGG